MNRLLRSILDRTLTSRPLNQATLVLLDSAFERYGHLIPRDALEGLDSLFFRDMMGNVDLDGDGAEDSFRITVTNPWYDQRINGIELFIDGRRIPPERIVFRSDSADTRASDVVALEFAPGVAMQIISRGLVLADGLHLVEMTLEMELAPQIIPILPILVRGGAGDIAVLADRFQAQAWPPLELEPGTVHVVPHIHYDVEWLQTREVFEKVGAGNLLEMLRLMEENPRMTFAVDQVPQLEPFRRSYPEAFERIVELVGEGRIEPLDGMYSEPDVNLVGGESLVRQSVAWQRYAMEHFGAFSRCGWLIDSFGMSGQLPQIFADTGVEFFAYSRARPPEGTPSEFLWEGIDGTRIVTTAMPLKYNVGHPMPVEEARALRKMLKDYRFLRSRSATDQVFYPAGVDHGRPQKEQTTMATAWNEKVDGVEFRPSLPSAFFESLPRDRLPVVRGELQRELWGTYSSRIEIKQLDRACEFALLDAGKLATIATLAGAPYPRDELSDGWRDVMDNQFHDQICGCCTDEVATGMRQRFGRALRAARGVMEGCARFLAGAPAAGSKAGRPDDALLVFNPLAEPVTSFVEFEVAPPPGWSGLSVGDGKGFLPVQILDARRYGDGTFKRVRAGFLPTLPATGYRIFELGAGAAEQPASAEPVRVSDTGIANGLLELRVDGSTGLLGEVLLSGGTRLDLSGGNRLTMRRDFGNLYESMPLGPSSIYRRKVRSVRAVEWGPLRGTIEVAGTIGRTAFAHRISLTSGSPRIDIETRVDYRDSGTMLTCTFPTGIRDGKWTHEIPYGCIERPGEELPAINFVDLSGRREGVTLINTGIPGNACDDEGTIALTLLRGVDGIWLWKAGQGALGLGEHTFHYALYPHRGDRVEAGSVAEAYRHNDAPRSFVIPAGRGENGIAAESGALGCSGGHFQVSVLEREDSGEIVVRLWETDGSAGKAVLSLGWDAARAWKTDMLGRRKKEVSLEGRSLAVELGPYEIATLVVS